MVQCDWDLKCDLPNARYVNFLRKENSVFYQLRLFREISVYFV